MADNYWVPMRLPSPKEIAKYALWGTGRVVLSGWLFGLYGVTAVCKATIHVAEMTKQTTLQLLKVYDQLPYMGASKISSMWRQQSLQNSSTSSPISLPPLKASK
jgi:hypothetical protein